MILTSNAQKMVIDVDQHCTMNILYVYTVKLKVIMPRTSDINAAFAAAIQQNPKGYRYLDTDSFLMKLRELNWHFSRADANAWIERYQPDFADKTEGQGENRYWILRNMGRVR